MVLQFSQGDVTDDGWRQNAIWLLLPQGAVRDAITFYRLSVCNKAQI
ncbi:hypothetical protein [Nostoc sp.]